MYVQICTWKPIYNHIDIRYINVYTYGHLHLKNNHAYMLKTSAHTPTLCYFIIITHALTYNTTNTVHTFIHFGT